MTKAIIKNSKKLLLFIALCVVGVLLAFGLSGCGISELTEKDIADRGYSVVVVYNYGGGNLADKEETRLLVKPDSYLPEPGEEKSKFNLPTFEKHSLKGFYVAQTDEETGKLLHDDDGNLIPGRAWNFDADKVTQNITLVAQWWDNYRIIINYGDDYASQSSPVYVGREKDGSPKLVYRSAFNLGRNYTIIDYFLDANEQQTIPFNAGQSYSYRFPSEDFEASEDGLTVNVWVKALAGSYNIVRAKSDLKSISNSANVYLYRDVNMEGGSVSFPSGTYTGTFMGNGHTISNMKVSFESADKDDGDFALFKKLGGTANISDVTFTNLTLDYSLKNIVVKEYNLGVLAGIVNAGATVSNVKIEGCTVSYKLFSGYSSDSVHVSDYIGHIEKSDISKVTDCSATGVTINGVKSIKTTDNKYLVYVAYTIDTEGNTTYGELQNLITEIRVNDNTTTYRTINLLSTMDPPETPDVYVLKQTGNRSIFTVTLTRGVGLPTADIVVTSANAQG